MGFLHSYFVEFKALSFTHSLTHSLAHLPAYLQEKVTGSFKEGKVHEDVWVLQLKPGLTTASAAGGRSVCVFDVLA